MIIKSKVIILGIILVMLVSISTVVASDLNDTDDIVKETNLNVQTTTDGVVLEHNDVQIDSGHNDNNTKDILTSSNDDDVLGESPATFGALNNYIRTYSGSEIPLTQDATGTGSQISVTKSNIVIDGQGNTLDASSRSRIFYITGNNVTLKNIKFVNGYYSSGNGGAIYTNKNLNIINCTFENNYAGTAGGVIHGAGNNIILNIYNSTFNNNSASYAGVIFGQLTNGYLNIYNCSFNNNSILSNDMSLGGGVISTQSSTVLYINSSNFTGNEANNTEGGCIRHSGSATIENSIFDSNVARDGAAICSGNDAALVYIYNNTFKNNFAYRWGGALQERNAIVNNSKFFNNIADLTSESSTEFGPFGGAIMVRNWIEVYNSEFEGNQARKGGAIYFEKRTDTATVQNCTFRNNSAIDYGGAITTELIGGTVNIKDSNFTENFAPAGGAIYMGTLKGAGTVRISGSNFNNNNATVTSGGAIYSGGGVLNIANSNFTQNYAIDDGGAVYAKDAVVSYSNFIENEVSDCGGAIYTTASLNIESSNLNKNTAIYGGAIYAQSILSSYVTLTNNNATAGGALYLDGTTSTANNIERSTFTDNKADDGGAIYVNAGAGSISNSNFISNYAGNDAGALFWNRGNGRVIRSTFRNNNASKDGGAIFWAADAGYVQSTFENNNATSRGGAIYWGGDSGTVVTSTFTSNAADKGLDIYWRGNSGTLQESIFNGGGRTSDVVYWHGLSGALEENSFVNSNIYFCQHSSASLTQNTQTSSSSGYSIKNDGNITLSKNNFDNPIYNNNLIESSVSIEVLNNKSIITSNPSFDVYTVILDDNGNYIKLPDGLNNSYAGNTYTTTFNNSHYLFKLPSVKLGVHVISVDGDYSPYFSSLTIKSGTLIYMLLDVNVTIVEYGETVIINATLVNTTENGTGSIWLNDQEYNVTFTNGSASLVLHNVAPNNYLITVEYEKYNQTLTTTTSFEIQLRGSNLTITTNNITAGENNTITVNVTNGTTGTVYIFVNGEMYIRTLVNSTAQVNLTNVAGGIYNIYAVYTGNSYFEDCHGSAVFNATKIAPVFTINATDALVGQDNVIKVSAPNDITGTLHVYVDDVEYSFDKQPISFAVSNMTAGTHNVRVMYAGDNKYLAGNNTTTFKVYKKNITMSLSTKYIVVGQNETIQVTVPSDATGIILINVNGTKYYVYANNTKATLTVPNLKYGTYNVTATYVEDDLYLEKSVSSIFKVDYADIDPIITYDVDSDLNVVVNVTVPSDATGDINIEVDGKNYTAHIIKGLFTVPINDLEGGEYPAKMYFENDTKYKDSIKDFTIKLSKVNTRIHIDAPTIYVDENATITVTVAPDATGNVTIRIANKTYTTSVINGTSIFTVSGLKAGTHVINATYTGDRKYLSDDEEDSLVVRKVDLSPYAYMDVNSIYVGEIATINITMPDDASGIVNLTIQEKLYVVTITNGRGQINISNLTYGVPTPIYASYSGNDKYLPCTRVNTAFAVHRISNYDVDIHATTNETAANITVTIPEDANGPGYITINNKTYNVEFVNGTVNITADNLTAGQKYEVYAYFGGDDKYTANDAIKTLNSDKSLDYIFDISANDIIVGQTAIIKIYLPNSTDGDNVTVKVAGKHDVTVSVFNGTLEYPVSDLKAGSHAVVVTYHGNDKYESRSRYANISVSKINMFNFKVDYVSPYVNENITFNITLPDDASGNITLRINNKDYPAVVVNGSAQVITDGLPAGIYNTTVFYSGNDKYNNRTQFITVQVLKIKEFDFTMNVSDIVVDENETIWVYLPKDIDGTVTITINDTIHIGLPVEMKDGVGSINISGLPAGIYNVHATLSNDTKYDDHTIADSFTVSRISDYDFNVTYNATVNVRDNITFILELPKDANGYANVTIFNKTYIVKVVNGSATINNITAKEDGTFPFIASFEQEGKYNYKTKEGYVLVSKVDVVLNPIYKHTVNVDENVTVQFILPKDATGNVSITSRGVTYSAKLVNGSANVTVAGFPLASVFSPSVSYTGDDKYNPASLSAKITVVKISDYELNVTVENITVDQKEIVNITLPSDATDDVLISGNFSNETYSRLITNGTASITLSNLPAGTYNITVRYQGYSKYEEKSVTKTFTVSKVVPPIDLEFVNNDTIIVKLPTNANGYANITVGDKIDTQIEIVNGIGSLNVSGLRPGDYFVNATFLGGVRYLPNNTNMTITIPKIKDYVLPISVKDITVGENATIIITLPENATGNVNLTINDGEIIIVPINNGYAIYNASNLKVGNYTVKANYSNVEYELQSNSSEFKVNKIKTVITDVLIANATNLTVNVTLTEGVTGNVTIIIDGIAHIIENIDSNNVSLTVPIIPDEHDIVIIYSGDENHTNATKTDYIEIFKITDYTILVEAAPLITVLDNNVVNVTLPKGIEGTVHIRVNGVSYAPVKINSTTGKATLKLPALENGNYTVIASFSNDVYDYQENSTNFTVIKLNTTIAAEVQNITKDLDEIINITLNDSVDGNVLIQINGLTYYTVVDDGFGTLTVSNLDEGNYTVVITYLGDNYFNMNSTTVKFTVSKIPLNITINGTDVVVGKDVPLTIELSGNITTVVTVNIDDKNYTAIVYEGKGSLNIPDLKVGKYNATVYYLGNDYYLAVNNTTTVNVNPKSKPSISVNVTDIVVGDDAIIRVVVNVTEGQVTLAMAGNPQTLPVVNGTVNFTVSNLSARNYHLTVTYLENDLYLSNNATADFVVYKKQSDININVTNIKVGDVETIKVNVTEGATGHVLIDIAGVQVYVNLTDSEAIAVFDDLGVNTYNVTVTYLGDENYNGTHASASFNVTKLDLGINITSADVIVVGHPVNFKIYTNESITEVIYIIIGENNYTSFVKEGVGNFTAYGLGIGNYTATVEFPGNSKFNPVNNFTMFNVTGKNATRLTVSVMNITVGDDAIIRVVVDGAKTGNVTLAMAGNPQTLPVVDGTVNFTVSNLSARNYHLTVTYLENDEYLSSSAIADFVVNKKNSTITLNVSDSHVGDLDVINVTVTPGATGHILISVGGMHIYVDINGSNVLSVNITELELGSYNVTATYLGDDVYKESSTNASFNVTKSNIAINIESQSIVVGHPEVFTITTSVNITEVITIIIDGVNYTSYVKDGKGTFTVYDLEVGNHTAIAYFPGNTRYVANSSSTKFNVTGKNQSAVTIKVNNITVGENATIYVNVTPGATGIVSIVIGGEVHNVQLIEGKASYNVSGLKAGEYSVTAYYLGDDNFLISNASAHFTVNKKSTPIEAVVTNATVGSTEVITVSVNKTAKGIVLLFINGSSYYGLINNGQVIFNVTGLQVGNHTATIYYEGNEEFMPNLTRVNISTNKIKTLINITVVKNITVGELVSFIIETSENITDLVNVEIDGQNYSTFLVDGYGTLNVVMIDNGTFTATVYYDGDYEYFAAHNSTDFVVNAKLPSEINITVQNITVGDDLTVNINVTEGTTGWLYVVIAGTAYNVELNDSKANITVHNLLARNYQVSVYYFGDTYYLESNNTANFTVFKKNSTMAANATNVTVGNPVTIAVNITEGTTGVLLFDIAGNDYYINLTVSDPILVLNNLPVGNYTVNITYLGDNNYNPSKTSTKFNVTKVDPEFTIAVVDGPDFAFGENVVIKVNGPADFTGIAIVYVNNTDGDVVNYTVYINNGVGYWTIVKPDVDKYNVTAIYQENFKYNSKESNSVKFEVYMNGTDLNVQSHDIKVGENETINVIIGNGEFTGFVTIIFDDNGTEFTAPISYNATTNMSTAQLNMSGFISGLHHVKATYVQEVEGRTIVHEGTDEFNVEKIESKLTIDDIADITVGNNVTIKLNIDPEEATGNIDVYVNGVLYPVTTDNLTLIIPNLGAAHYNVQAFYGGNDKYLESAANASFNVYKNNVTLILNVSSITVGDVELINVTVASDAEGYVLIKINDTPYYAEIISGVARISIPDMYPGKYNVTATFIGDDKYYENSTNDSFTVSKIKPVIEIKGETIVVGNVEVLNITASDNLTVVIKIEVDGKNYTSFISNGKGNFTIGGLTNNTYVAKVFFEGNEIYDAANDTTTFEVTGKLQSELIINVSDITVGDNLTVVVNVTEGATGSVTIVIAGNTYTEPINGNQAIFNVPDLSARDYHITAHYFGDDKFLYSNATGEFTVNKKVANLIIDVTNATVGSTEYINVTLPNGAKGYVLITIEGSHYYSVVVDNVARFNVTGLLVGNHTAYVTYIGDDIYNSTSAEANITTSQLTTTITISGSTIYVGQVERLTIETSENITALVTVVVDGNRNFTTFISEGKGSLIVVNLTRGTHTAAVYYDGDHEYLPAHDSTEFEVLDKKPVNVTVTAESIKVGDDAIIYVTVIDAETGDNVTGRVTIALAGTLYEVTLKNGTANITVDNLSARNYHVTAHYEGNIYYFENENFTEFAVRKLETPIDFNVTTIKVGQDEIINITLPEKASGDLIITVGNVSYYKQSNGGNVNITISGLGNGTYPVTVEYKGNDIYSSNYTSKEFAVIKNTPEISIELINNTVQVNLTKDVAGDVNITIGNISEIVPVIRGIATLDVSGLMPGDYTVNATYLGDDKYETVNDYETVNIPKIDDYEVIVNVDNITVGENATVEVILPEGATGFVNITVNGNTTEVPIVNGTARLNVTDLGIGDHNITVEYGGNTIYGNTSVNKTINVNGLDLAPEIEIGENGTIVIRSLENATGNITITIGNETYEVPIVNGTATWNGTNLEPGEHTIILNYTGDDKYNPFNETAIVNVPKLKSTVEANASNIVEGSVESISIKVIEGATGIVLINVNGTGYYKEIVDSKVILDISGLTEGEYDVTVIYNGDSKYANSSTATSFKVIKVDKDVITEGNDSSVVFDVQGNETGGNITVVINGNNYAANITNGTASVDLGEMLPGEYEATVIYVDRDGNRTEYNTTIVVPKWTPTIQLNVADIDEGETESIIITVPGDATGVVLVDVNGIGYYVNVTDGIATLNVPGLKEGNYPVKVTYMGDDKYENVSTTGSFNVKAVAPPVKPDIIITLPEDVEVGETPVVNVTLPANATGNVTVFVDGREYANVPVVNGTAQIPVENLSAGDHIVEVRYSGDDNYAPSSNFTELTVSKVDPNINASSSVSTEGETATITVDVPSDATGVVLVDIDGKKYYADIKDGKATVEVDGLKAGNYTAVISYPGDSKYGNSTTSVPMEVKSAEPTPEPEVPSMNVTLPEDAKVGETPTVSVELPKDATGNVSVLVDGKEVANVPVVNGTAQIPLDDLPAGDHAVEVKYSGDDKYAPTSKSGDLSVDKLAPNMGVDVNDTQAGEDAVITVDVPSDATGVALVDVDGVGYYAEIKDGKATVSVPGLKDGNHTVTVTFPGDSKYANESVTKSFNVTKKQPIATVIVIDPKFTRNATDYYAGEKGGYIYGVLMDTNGNRLANKVVQVAVNGPVYNITTDENGLIPVQINLMNANVYTYALFFQGDEDYNASHIASSKLTIIKKTTAIKASNKSFKAKAKTKTVKVTLTTIKNAFDGKTYLKAGKKITMKVNGKTYKAKTNGNGVVKFNIKLTKKGKYTAKIKFKGSKTYEACKKNIKITIK